MCGWVGKGLPSLNTTILKPKERDGGVHLSGSGSYLSTVHPLHSPASPGLGMGNRT